jgi:trehalose 6-phosphate phosphatase
MKESQFWCTGRRRMREMRGFPSSECSLVRSIEKNDASLNKRIRDRIERSGTPPLGHAAIDRPRSAFRAWPEIRARLLAADHWAFFLDFDGTLVSFRRRPSDVQLPERTRRVLRRLVAHAGVYVAIVSGRSLRSLQRLVDVEGLHCFGLHGAERDGISVTLSPATRVALEGAKFAAKSRLGVMPGIWIEDKGLSFAVHHRDADRASAQAARATLSGLLAPWEDVLHILNGSRVWEVLPNEIPGKSSTVQELLGRLPAGTAAVYIGDDGTDEAAFAALAKETTVRVGCGCVTSARYCVRAPADVVRFLARAEKDLP